MPRLSLDDRLSLSLDPAYVSRVIEESRREAGQPPLGIIEQAELVSSKAAHSVIRYTLALDDASYPTIARNLFGKVYRKRKRAPELAEISSVLLERLQEGPREPAWSPATVAVLPEIGLHVQQLIDAPDLRSLIRSEGGRSAVAAAADWLATLHQVEPVEAVSTVSGPDEIALTLNRLSRMQPTLDTDRYSAIVRHLNALESRDVSAPKLSMIHGDFHAANLLWDGSHIWGIDLDRIKIGDPARDVASFVAQLRGLSYDDFGEIDAFTDVENTFLDAYFAAAGDGVSPRLSFYRAATCVLIGSQRTREGKMDAADRFADLAIEELSALAETVG